jgi:hypothetical protein
MWDFGPICVQGGTMKRLTGSVLILTGVLGACAAPAHGQSFPFNRRGPVPASAPAQMRLAPVPQPAAMPVVTETMTMVDSSVELAAMQTATVTIDPNATSRGASAGGPPIQLVNSRSLVLDFELKGVGASGLGNIELYYTRNGQIWHKHNGPVPSQSPIPVDVSEDGLYGFTVVASNGVGLGRTPPQPGDPPQIWVEVDTTKPEVKLLSTQAGVDVNGRTLTLRWTATDKNLVNRPITLSYAEQAQGPWTPFATNVDNTGLYTWHMSPGLPNQVLLKVEATDRIGNVGDDQSAMPAPIDLSRPQAILMKASRNGVLQPVSDK